MGRVVASCLVAALAALTAAAAPEAKGEARRAKVVFACEHGSAKSLIAASFFGRMAREHGLVVEGLSRGTAPDAAVPELVARALRADGFDVASFRPQALSEADVDGAVRVVAIGVDTGALGRRAGGRLERWDDIPPVSTSYPAAREVLVRHIRGLVRELEQARHP